MHTAPRHGSTFVRKAQHSSTFVLTLPSQRYAPQPTILIADKTGSQEGLNRRQKRAKRRGAGGHLSILLGEYQFPEQRLPRSMARNVHYRFQPARAGVLAPQQF